MSTATDLETVILDQLDFDVPLRCEVTDTADLPCGVTAEWILRCVGCGHSCLHCQEDYRTKVEYIADGGGLFCRRCNSHDNPEFIPIGNP